MKNNVFVLSLRMLAAIVALYQCSAAPIQLKSIVTERGVVNVLSVEESPFNNLTVHMIDMNDARVTDYLLLVGPASTRPRLFELGNQSFHAIDAETLRSRSEVREVVERLLPEGVTTERLMVGGRYELRRVEVAHDWTISLACFVSAPGGFQIAYKVFKSEGRHLTLSMPGDIIFGLGVADQGTVGSFSVMELWTSNERYRLQRRNGCWYVHIHCIANVPWRTEEEAISQYYAKDPNVKFIVSEDGGALESAQKSEVNGTCQGSESGSLGAPGSSSETGVTIQKPDPDGPEPLTPLSPTSTAPARSPLRPHIPEPMGSVSADPVEGEPQSRGIHQPSYSAWRLIVDGMTKTQVLDLLGHPVAAQKPTGPGYLHSWNYGTVVPKSQLFPEEFAFMIWFSDDKVVAKEDPFGGVFSDDGRPSAPRLIIPTNDQAFEHCPRIVDMRWYPCSGEYPMQYDVEFDTLNRPGGWRSKVLQQDTPFLAVSFGGNTKGRWRVRGKNSKGEGPWSEYRYFEFTR